MMKNLTHLEFTAIGNIWKKGPSTAYAIMKEFSTSPSAHYRSSAGSIYPLMRRLHRRGLLTTKTGRKGKRRHKTFSLTAKGRRALTDWLSPPLAEGAGSTTYDPLRTRVYFLAALTPPDRRAFAKDAKQQLQAQLSRNLGERERYRTKGDLFSELAAEGSIAIMRARLRWIDRVAAKLS